MKAFIRGGDTLLQRTHREKKNPPQSRGKMWEAEKKNLFLRALFLKVSEEFSSTNFGLIVLKRDKGLVDWPTAVS